MAIKTPVSQDSDVSTDTNDRVVSVRLKHQHYGAVARTSEKLGLDISAFVRMAVLQWMRSNNYYDD